MVAVPVRDEYIIRIAKVCTQQFCISDKRVARSRIEQNLVTLRFHKN